MSVRCGGTGSSLSLTLSPRQPSHFFYDYMLFTLFVRSIDFCWSDHFYLYSMYYSKRGNNDPEIHNPVEKVSYSFVFLPIRVTFFNELELVRLDMMLILSAVIVFAGLKRRVTQSKPGSIGVSPFAVQTPNCSL